MSTILEVCQRTGTPTKPTKVEPITCTLEVVTPMFLAGADNRPLKRGRPPRNGQPGEPDVPGVTPAAIALEGLRSASIKAALRFWWRAGQPMGATEQMRLKEGKLFGTISAGNSTVDTQGCTVRSQVLDPWNGYVPTEINHNELCYLAYGCADLNGPLRPAIRPGSKARITIHPTDSLQHKELELVLERWLLFGNSGAKSRRGWGGLSDDRWSNIPALQSAITRHLMPGNPAEPPWTSLQGAVSFVKPLTGPWAQALNELGRIFHQFRKDLGADKIMQGGQFRQIPGKPYGIDHDRVASWIHGTGLMDRRRGDTRDTLPLRTGFGLPYPLQFSGGAKPTLTPEGNDIGDRRASPVFFKLHKMDTGFVGMVTIMGGRFLPDDAKVQIRDRQRSLTLGIAPRPQVLADFANHLQQQAFTRIAP